jgi:hypothetical protein
VLSWGWIGAILGVGTIVAVVLIYAWITHRLNRRSGGRGVVQRSRLDCPKCGRTFDYEWIPGAALTAVRLGRNRYMACPLCRRWSTFIVTDTLIAPPSPLVQR